MKPNENPRLVATDVTVTRGTRRIVDTTSLTLNAGEFTILAGPNGAGKTTLARAMAGVMRAEGSVTFDGANLRDLAPRVRARAISYLPQGHEFHWPMRVDSIVALGREPHADPFSQTSVKDRIAIERAIEATAVGEFSSRLITTLSGGERARVAIARALATEASVLIADEPTASLDERHQLIVMDLLQRIAHQGTAVLAIIHDLALAMRFADRVVVMNEGRIVANDTPPLALTPDRIAEIFGISVNRVETPDGPLLLPSRAL
ncbi:iron complex transport system ATP-binding protein [Afipia massiliensis]|uniref:Iron complex transport system ATP-binding protein n=1 Tax=Afipia massiliensis TaxID=211460 RepID=A0A840N3M5_9BRAD|nr:ABC transporter ATP-binding protein [Afipia massiliensis]MBB5053137.1 iron complex transport system ATP-binding protein [Afipia massiliensis]